MNSNYIECHIVNDELLIKDKNRKVNFPEGFKKAAALTTKLFSTLYVPASNPKTGLWELASRYCIHPDRKFIEKWLQTQNMSADELDVICWAATFVLLEWKRGPKRTATEHRKLFHRIESLCGELVQALTESDEHFLDDTSLGLANATVRQLLTNDEQSESYRRLHYVLGPITDAPAVANLATAIQKPFDLTMEELLKRLAKTAATLGARPPLHTQPKKRGAERGFFVRTMGELFKLRYGVTPVEAIAAISTIALQEPTERELVAKLLT